jgi:hypothetical protein
LLIQSRVSGEVPAPGVEFMTKQATGFALASMGGFYMEGLSGRTIALRRSGSWKEAWLKLLSRC